MSTVEHLGHAPLGIAGVSDAFSRPSPGSHGQAFRRADGDIATV
ncbi:hypothetical protein [Amycolatopsis sp. NPDC003676]